IERDGECTGRNRQTPPADDRHCFSPLFSGSRGRDGLEGIVIEGSGERIDPLYDRLEPLWRNRKLRYRTRPLKGVIDRRSNRGADRIDAAFSRAFHSKGIQRTWCVLRHDNGNIRYFACSRHKVVGERDRERFTVLVVTELLQKSTAYALGQRARDL